MSVQKWFYLTGRKVPIPKGTKKLDNPVLWDSTDNAIIKAPNMWHTDANLGGSSAIATRVTQNAKMLEKKSLYCKTWDERDLLGFLTEQ